MEIRLKANDNGRILGPFPAGDYLASFGALTAIGKGYVPVTIENGVDGLIPQQAVQVPPQLDAHHVYIWDVTLWSI